MFRCDAGNKTCIDKFNWHLDTVNTAAEAGSEKAMEGKENVREKMKNKT